MSRFRPAVAATVFMTIASALAQAGSIEARLQTSVVTRTADGSEQLLQAGQAKPGEVLDYRVSYHNSSQQIASAVFATLPVPAGVTVYLPDTTRATPVLASLDGKRFSQVPLQRVVRRADGQRVIEPVPASEYRFLRWELGDLAAGESVEVGTRLQMTGDHYVAVEPELQQREP